MAKKLCDRIYVGLFFSYIFLVVIEFIRVQCILVWTVLQKNEKKRVKYLLKCSDVLISL